MGLETRKIFTMGLEIRKILNPGKKEVRRAYGHEMGLETRDIYI